MPRRIRTRLALSLLILSLSASVSAAAPETPAAAEHLSSFWSLLSCTFFGGEACFAIRSDSDIGCGIDPHGGACAPTVRTGDIGCGIDPHGEGCLE